MRVVDYRHLQTDSYAESQKCHLVKVWERHTCQTSTDGDSSEVKRPPAPRPSTHSQSRQLRGILQGTCELISYTLFSVPNFTVVDSYAPKKGRWYEPIGIAQMAKCGPTYDRLHHHRPTSYSQTCMHLSRKARTLHPTIPGRPVHLFSKRLLTQRACRSQEKCCEQTLAVRVPVPKGSNVVPFWAVYYNPQEENGS